MEKNKDDDRKPGSQGGSGNFKDNPERAAEAGRKGGQASHGGGGSDNKQSGQKSGQDDR